MPWSGMPGPIESMCWSMFSIWDSMTSQRSTLLCQRAFSAESVIWGVGRDRRQGEFHLFDVGLHGFHFVLVPWPSCGRACRPSSLMGVGVRTGEWRGLWGGVLSVKQGR